MRRKEREINASKEIDEITEKADVCLIGLSDNHMRNVHINVIGSRCRWEI